MGYTYMYSLTDCIAVAQWPSVEWLMNKFTGRNKHYAADAYFGTVRTKVKLPDDCEHWKPSRFAALDLSPPA